MISSALLYDSGEGKRIVEALDVSEGLSVRTALPLRSLVRCVTYFGHEHNGPQSEGLSSRFPGPERHPDIYEMGCNFNTEQTLWNSAH